MPVLVLIEYKPICTIYRQLEQGYQQFLRKNPDSRFAYDVQKQLYKAAYLKTVETNTAEAFDEYIRKYPESPYLENLIRKKEAF